MVVKRADVTALSQTLQNAAPTDLSHLVDVDHSPGLRRDVRCSQAWELMTQTKAAINKVRCTNDSE